MDAFTEVLMTRAIWTATALLLGATAIGCASGPSATAISDRPDTPFKLATFEAAGQTRLGLVLGARVLDIAGANQHLTTTARLAPLAIPTEMKALIEQYATVSPRLYQIANYFGANAPTNQPFAFDEAAVTFKAPIKYPWNLMAASANYKAHAEGMGAAGAAQAPPPRPDLRPPGPRPAASTPPPPRASCRTATRPSCSRSPLARASSIPTSRSTSWTVGSEPTTRVSWPS